MTQAAPTRLRSAARKRQVGRPAGETSQETEKRILDGAERLFAQVGFSAARTQDIAEQAGVTKAMIYYYFKTKEKLYRAVLDRLLSELGTLVQELGTLEVDHLTHLERFLDETFEYMVRHPTVGRLSFLGSGPSGRYMDAIVTTFIRPMFKQAVEFFEDGMRKGVFRDADARQIILSVYASAMGYFADARFISLVLGGDAMSEPALRQRKRALIDQVFQILGVQR